MERGLAVVLLRNAVLDIVANTSGTNFEFPEAERARARIRASNTCVKMIEADRAELEVHLKQRAVEIREKEVQ